MYHFNPSFFETATNLFNAVVVPQCLRSLIQFLISHEHILDQYFIEHFECFYQHALVKFYIPTEATRKGLAMSKPVSGYLSLPAQPFLVDVLQFEYPAIYWHP